MKGATLFKEQHIIIQMHVTILLFILVMLFPFGLPCCSIRMQLQELTWTEHCQTFTLVRLMVYFLIRWTCILDLYLVLQKCIIYFISTFSQGNFVVVKKGGEKDCFSRYFQFVNPYCVSTLDHR